VRRRDWHWHGQTLAVEVLQELGLPREISVTPATEATDREMPVDAHAPHLIDANSASERFNTRNAVAPLLECIPSH
jgi:hypothetical protein